MGLGLGSRVKVKAPHIGFRVRVEGLGLGLGLLAPPKGLSTSGNAEQNRPYLLGLGLEWRGVGLGLRGLG